MITEEEQEILLGKGILIEPGCDEIVCINEDRSKSINCSDAKTIRIWTTSACNANCYYCFEKGIHPVKMEKATADHVITYIEKVLRSGDKIDLCWFGGEPLVNESLIDYMTPRIMEVCRKRDCTCRFSMINNGSLITEEISDKMKNEWGIKFIQVTLDGMEDEYNFVKKYKEPEKYNFQTVINSIKLLARHDIKISIRMNYNGNNYETLKELII